MGGWSFLIEEEFILSFKAAYQQDNAVSNYKAEKWGPLAVEYLHPATFRANAHFLISQFILPI